MVGFGGEPLQGCCRQLQLHSPACGRPVPPSRCRVGLRLGEGGAPEGGDWHWSKCPRAEQQHDVMSPEEQIRHLTPAPGRVHSDPVGLGPDVARARGPRPRPADHDRREGPVSWAGLRLRPYRGKLRSLMPPTCSSMRCSSWRTLRAPKIPIRPVFRSETRRAVRLRPCGLHLTPSSTAAHSTIPGRPICLATTQLVVARDTVPSHWVAPRSCTPSTIRASITRTSCLALNALDPSRAIDHSAGSCCASPETGDGRGVATPIGVH
jgi:hypothetical protein